MRLIPLLLLSMSLYIVSVHGLRDASIPDILFPFGADVGDSIVPPGDDVSSPAVYISTGFPFMFSNYSTVYVRI